MQSSPLAGIPSFGAPTLEGFDTSNIVPGQRIGGINRQYVRFYKKTVNEIHADKVSVNPKTGEVKILTTKVVPVEREYVHIKTPGDKNEVDDFAQPFHKKEHWAAYTAFREGRTAPMGVPLDECSFISPNIAIELKVMGVHVLEQLADASDHLCNHVANGWELREYARAMVKVNSDSKSSAELISVKGELAKAQEMIAAMQSQMRGLVLDKNGTPVESAEPEVEKKSRAKKAE